MKQTLTRAVAGTALATTAVLGLAACGSSHTTNTAPKPSVTPSTAAPTASTGPAAADAATTAAVTKAYTTFFNGTKNPAASMAALQNGTQLAAVMAQAAKSPTAADISAKVSKVTLVNAHVADVTFSLFSKGFAVLTNTSGKAVLVNGHWQVAATTFCGLTAAQAGGVVPAGCTPALVALPSS